MVGVIWWERVGKIGKGCNVGGSGVGRVSINGAWIRRSVWKDKAAQRVIRNGTGCYSLGQCYLGILF